MQRWPELTGGVRAPSCRVALALVVCMCAVLTELACRHTQIASTKACLSPRHAPSVSHNVAGPELPGVIPAKPSTSEPGLALATRDSGSGSPAVAVHSLLGNIRRGDASPRQFLVTNSMQATHVAGSTRGSAGTVVPAVSHCGIWYDNRAWCLCSGVRVESTEPSVSAQLQPTSTEAGHAQAPSPAPRSRPATHPARPVGTPEPVIVTLTGVGRTVSAAAVVDNGFVVRIDGRAAGGTGDNTRNPRVNLDIAPSKHARATVGVAPRTGIGLDHHFNPGANTASPQPAGVADLVVVGPTCVSIRAAGRDQIPSGPHSRGPTARAGEPRRHRVHTARPSREGPATAEAGMLMVLASSMTPSAWDSGSVDKGGIDAHESNDGVGEL